MLTQLLTWALAGKTVDVDVAGMLLSILWVVILPIVVGLIVKWIWPKFTEKATDFLPAISTIAIALIVAIVIAANANKLMAGGLIIVVVVMLHNLCGLSLGYLIGRMLGLSEPRIEPSPSKSACRTQDWPASGNNTFCCLSSRYHSWSYLQCVAQYQRSDGSLFLS